ncbi:MAG: hypothetical protein R3C25_08055 [Hyphomonadaceae bacterium]
MDEENRTAFLRIDFNELSNLAHVGPRRACAFLKMGLHSCENPPEDFTLQGGIAYRFLPDNTPQLVDQIKTEFSAWIVGSGLKELDHCFSLFLDKVWFTTRIIRLHGATVPSHIRIGDNFADETNTARKLQRINTEIGGTVDLGAFESLSLARNALTHGAGIVAARHTNRERALEIIWVAPELVVQDGADEIVYRAEPADMHRVKSPDGAQVLLRFSRHSVTFQEGERIRLTTHNLAEICAFYQSAGSHILEKLKGRVLAAGIRPDAA